MLSSTRRFLAPLLALAITTGTLTAVAQSKKSSARSKTTTSAKSETSKYHRLPTYFGKLELKDDQREEIYSIKEQYGPKIEELQQELAELKEEMNEEITDVLTTTQKSALAKLNSGSSSTKAKPVSSSRSKASTSKKKSSAGK